MINSIGGVVYSSYHYQRVEMNDGKFEGKLVGKALQKVLCQFIKSGIDFMGLANQLYSEDIIQESLHSRITGRLDGLDNSDRLRDVLLNIKSSAEYDPTVFVKFLNVLRLGDFGSIGKGIATIMETRYAGQ